MRHSVARRVASVVLAGLAAASLVVSPSAGASAESDYAQAKAEIRRLEGEWNRLADEYSANADKLYSLEKDVAQTETRIEKLKSVVEEKKGAIGAQAVSVYKHGSARAGAALSYMVSPDQPDDISRASKYMDEVQGKTRDAVNELHASREDLDAELKVLNEKKDAQAELVAELESSSDEIESRLARQKEIAEKHRRRLEAERRAAREAKLAAARAAKQQAQAPQASSSGSQSSGSSSTPAASSSSGGSSSGASFGKGRLAPWAAAYGDMLRANYSGISAIGGWRASGSVKGSDHPKGLAIDAMITSKAAGDAIAARAASDIGSASRVKYVIWNRRYYSGRGSSPYSGPSPHTDHVHISFY